jgi:hypothetical protein
MVFSELYNQINKPHDKNAKNTAKRERIAVKFTRHVEKLLNIVPAAIEWFIEDQAFSQSAPSKIVFPKFLLAYKPVQILAW